MSQDPEYLFDDWPENYDGRILLKLIKENKNPFKEYWNPELLIREVEEKLESTVEDISNIDKGSNNYGLFLHLSDGRRIVARPGVRDVNMPYYDGFELSRLVKGVEFEAALYTLTSKVPDVKTSTLLYHRAPQETSDRGLVKPPTTILGRKLLLYLPAEGDKNVWNDLSSDQRLDILTQAAKIRSTLFSMPVPADFAEKWLPRTLFNPAAQSLPFPITPTHQHCLNLLQSRVHTVIGELGEMIGWPEDEETVGPTAFAAKTSLLTLLPLILPDGPGNQFLYRFVIEHGDFGLHNMTLREVPDSATAEITSVYDWEASGLVPAIFSNPQMIVSVDLNIDSKGNPVVGRLDGDESEEFLANAETWLRHYYKTLFAYVPDYEEAIKAGLDARHIWFMLKAWRGGGAEDYFGELGAWAEKRYAELQG